MDSTVQQELSAILVERDFIYSCHRSCVNRNDPVSVSCGVDNRVDGQMCWPRSNTFPGYYTQSELRLRRVYRCSEYFQHSPQDWTYTNQRSFDDANFDALESSHNIKRKLQLGGLFSLVIITMAVAIVRVTVISNKAASSGRNQVEITWLYMWHFIENSVGR